MATATPTKPKSKSKPQHKALLELNTLAPIRPFATIDGVQHDFRMMQEFGATEHQQFNRDSGRYDELFGSDDDLTPDQADRMVKLLEGLFRRVLVDPDALAEQLGDRLTGEIKRELLLTFTNAPWLMAQQKMTMSAQEPRDRSTTES